MEKFFAVGDRFVGFAFWCSGCSGWCCFSHDYFNLAPAFVGMTAVAIGTSLPEIVAAAYASYKDEDELAVGTALGSNLFLLMFALPWLS